MIYPIVRIVCVAALTWNVKAALTGDALSVTLIIISCLIYLHAAMYETIEDVLNGSSGDK